MTSSENLHVGIAGLCRHCGEPITVIDLHEYNRVRFAREGQLGWIHVGNQYTNGERYFICGNMIAHRPIDVSEMASPRW